MGEGKESFRLKKQVSIKQLEETILRLLEEKALYTMEICRYINNVPFGSCRSPLAGFGDTKAPLEGGTRCAKIENQCQVVYTRIRYVLKKLYRKRTIRTVKFRWFDRIPISKGRGAVTDEFRFWYKNKETLGKRLVQDLVDIFNLKGISLDVVSRAISEILRRQFH